MNYQRCRFIKHWSSTVNEAIKTISSQFIIFFTKRFRAYKKHQNSKRTISTLLEVFMRAENRCLCCFFVRLFLVCLFFLIAFGWFAFFSRSKSFLKKMNWLEIVLIVSFTTLLTRQVRIDPVNIYLFKVNNGRSTKKACKICLELTKTSEPSTEIWQWSQKWK